MNELENISFDKLFKIYRKFFSMGYLGTDCSDKLACISLVCCITHELRKKGKNLNCYEVLCQIDKDHPEKNTFLKSLGAICEDLLYCCDKFPDFGIPLKEMPNTVKKLLNQYCPF